MRAVTPHFSRLHRHWRSSGCFCTGCIARRSSGKYRQGYKGVSMHHSIGRRWFSTIISIPLLALLFAGALWGADFKAGFGRRQITPPLPILMAGFANRTKPAETVANDLWTKALAFEDSTGQKLIIITVDLVTIPQPMIDMVAARVTHQNNID